MKVIAKIYLCVLVFFLSSFSSFSQAYKFRNYGVDEGISQPYIYTINQDKNGYLFVGTGEGLCKYDGIKFKSFYEKDGIAESFVTTSYRDKSRNLWFGHNQGSITFYNGKVFKSINTSGFAKSPITCIVEDKKGFIWCATQNDGVFRISKEYEVEVFKIEFDQENIFAINFTKNDQLLVGTDEGLMLYDLVGDHRTPKFLSIVDGIPVTRIQCIIKKNNSGSYWIGTENEGLFLVTLTTNPSELFKTDAIGKDIGIDFSSIQDVYEDAQSNLWIATFGNGVIKLLLSTNTLQYNEFLHFTEDNGLGNKFTKTIYADHEGNIWVGTYGTGLVQLIDNCFTFYSYTSGNVSNNVTAISIGKKIKWFGGENSLVKIDMSTKEKYYSYSQKNEFVNDKVTALYQMDTANLIIGTEKNGVYQLDIFKNKFEKIELNLDLLSNSINSITGYDKTLWIATKNGIFKIEIDKNIKTHFTTENGLSHNNINQVYLDHNNVLWIATHSNFLSSINKKGEIENKKIYFGSDLINITSIIEDKQGEMWAATFGNGVFNIAKNGIIKFSTENGLNSNYCYSIIDDGSNNIWVGHRKGLSCIKTEKHFITQFGKVEGITGDCNFNATYKDYLGNTWFGTSTGAVKFDPHKDKKNIIPPIVNVTSIKLNDKEADFTTDISLPYDNYRLRVDFIGISFKSNSQVTYQYKLEGYDITWSDKTNNAFAQYGKLGDGEYKFLIKAYNSDGVSSTSPFSIKILIEPPVWKRWWFIVLVVLGFGYAFYAFIKIRERNHRVFQVKLQKALNEKTREVIIQKEEIEKKNKDITDSIRYAKRIQDALLPHTEKLKRIVPESFIFFQPRDIVSGDFYWFEVYGNKLIIACADATGHGVPGAFMSMIGSTLLKDITSREDVVTPADALEILDEEIKLLLNQNNVDQEQTYDSIDVIICEIDLVTYFVKICSTKRSVYISSDNQLITARKEVSDFQGYEMREMQLKKGDTVYMFTDGYPDQFGGEKGKKIKTSNIKLLLEEIQSLPIEKQSMIVDRYFNRWKEGHDQVDDVLFIGVKL